MSLADAGRRAVGSRRRMGSRREVVRWLAFCTTLEGGARLQIKRRSVNQGFMFGGGGWRALMRHAIVALAPWRSRAAGPSSECVLPGSHLKTLNGSRSGATDISGRHLPKSFNKLEERIVAIEPHAHRTSARMDFHEFSFW